MELNTEYYDLGLPHARRDRRPGDASTQRSAIKRLHVGVKCATITPNAQRMEEYKLKEMWKSPNGTIRAILDGTVFRAPILTDMHPARRCAAGKSPSPSRATPTATYIRRTEYRVPGPGTADAAAFAGDRRQKSCSKTIYEFEWPRRSAGACTTRMRPSRPLRTFLLRTTRWPPSRICGSLPRIPSPSTYDQTFKLIFQDDFRGRLQGCSLKKAGITYFYTLIDDAVARVMRSEGGFIWACKNYDGDVMSDMVSAAFGSLAMMTSVLVIPRRQL